MTSSMFWMAGTPRIPPPLSRLAASACGGAGAHGWFGSCISLLPSWRPLPWGRSDRDRRAWRWRVGGAVVSGSGGLVMLRTCTCAAELGGACGGATGNCVVERGTRWWGLDGWGVLFTRTWHIQTLKHTETTPTHTRQTEGGGRTHREDHALARHALRDDDAVEVDRHARDAGVGFGHGEDQDGVLLCLVVFFVFVFWGG
jgi:hypothetical protein